MTDARAWDACVFLRLLTRGDDYETVDALLRECRGGRLRVMAAAIVHAEVLNWPGAATGPAPPDARARVEGLLKPPYVKEIVEIDERIAKQARDYCWDAGRWLKPVDATHLAAATSREVRVFETFDDALLDHAEDLFDLTGLEVRRPLAPTTPPGRPSAPQTA